MKLILQEVIDIEVIDVILKQKKKHFEAKKISTDLISALAKELLDTHKLLTPKNAGKRIFETILLEIGGTPSD